MNEVSLVWGGAIDMTAPVVCMFTNGDQRVCAITLFILPRKVYSKVLEGRVWPRVTSQTEYLFFCPGPGTADQLFTLGPWKGPGSLRHWCTCAF